MFDEKKLTDTDGIVIPEETFGANEIKYSAFSVDTGEVMVCVNAREITGYIEADLVFAFTILPNQKMYIANFSESAFFHGPVLIDTRHIVARFPNLYLEDLKKELDEHVIKSRSIRMERTSKLIIPSANNLIIT